MISGLKPELLRSKRKQTEKVDMAKSTTSVGPQKKTRRSPSPDTEDHSPARWFSLSVIMYTAASLLVGLYGAHVVSPHLLQSYANEYPVIKYLVYFFDAVEVYSPFHEFIKEDDDIQGDKCALRLYFVDF